MQYLQPAYLHQFFKNLDAFAEIFTTYSSYIKNIEVYINSGVTYSVSKNFNIDAGFNYGVNNGTDKIFFTGFSFRL